MDKIDPEDIIVKETFSFEGDPIPKYVEEESRREENVKHFSMPNGTYTAVVYPTAVHRKDADGVWQDINNDPSQRSVRGTQKYETADSRVSFALKLSGLTAKLESDGSISLSDTQTGVIKYRIPAPFMYAHIVGLHHEIVRALCITLELTYQITMWYAKSVNLIFISI